MSAPLFTGSAVALCTPFVPGGGVNPEVARQLIHFQLENGTDALVITGTTGEPSTMTQEEMVALWQTSKAAIAGRVPFITGVGSNNTAHAVQMAHLARESGADALLVVTPYYNKTNPAGLVAHYAAIAQAGLPIIVYNVPSRTGFNLTPALLGRLCEEVPAVSALKEASANINQMTEMVRLCGSRIAFYSGEDAIVLPAMSLGFAGVISVAANVVPALMHELCAAALANNYATARSLQFRVNPLVDALFCEVNPIPAKTALRHMGYDMGPLRLPLSEMDPANQEKLFTAMKTLL